MVNKEDHIYSDMVRQVITRFAESANHALLCFDLILAAHSGLLDLNGSLTSVTSMYTAQMRSLPYSGISLVRRRITGCCYLESLGRAGSSVNFATLWMVSIFTSTFWRLAYFVSMKHWLHLFGFQPLVRHFDCRRQAILLN